MTLRLTKRAIRVLTARYRAVLLAAIMGTFFAANAMAADVIASLDDYTSGITAGTTVIGTVDLSGKQDVLTTTQQSAVDSGITSALVGKITANETNIGTINTNIGYINTILSTLPTSYVAKDLSNLPPEQQAAIKSGVTATDVAQIGTNKTDIATINSTLSGYGDIVTHNVSEFASSAQGAAADAATTAIAKLNADSSTAGSVDYKIAQAASNYATAAQGAAADQAATDIGNMASLQTTATNLVAAINEVKGTADSAVQSVAEGTTNGTISVDGTNVAVHGLQSMAYEDAANYKVKDAGNGLENTSGTIAVKAADTTITVGAAGVKVGIITDANITDGTISQAKINGLTTALDNISVATDSSGVVTIKDDAGNTANVYSKGTADSTFAKLAGGNTFSGTNTFNGDIVSNGDITSTGDFSAADGTFSGTLTVTGTSTLGAVNAGAISGTTISGTTGSFTGALTSDTLTVNNAATLKSTLEVTGKTTLKGDLAGTTATFTGLVNTQGLNAGSGDITTTGDLSAGAATLSGALNGTTGTFSGVLSSDSLSVTKGATVGGNLGVSGTSAFTGLATFSNGISVGGKTVTAIETAAVAAGAGKTDTLATTATVLASAENGAYSGTKVKGDTASATLGTALDKGLTTLNGLMNTAGTMVLDEKVEVSWNGSDITLQAVLGSGDFSSVNQIADGDSMTTALSNLDKAIGNTTFSGKNATGAADLTVAVNSLDTAIGDRSALASKNTALNTATATSVAAGLKAAGDALGDLQYTAPSAVSYAAIAANTDLTTAVAQISKNVGAAVTTSTNGVAATQSVNENIDAVNTVIGDVSSLTGNALNTDAGVTPTTVVEALTNINYRLGTIHGLYDGTTVAATTNGVASTVSGHSNLAVGTSVDDHLVSLDNAIGDRTLVSGNAAIDAAMSGTSVAAGVQAAGLAIGNQNYTSTKYVTAGDDLTTAVSSLDENLNKVEGRVSGLEDRTQKMNREMKAGFASLAAMSALVPNARSAGDTQISLGTGYYRGTAGFALGAFHHFNDNVMMNVGAGYSAHGAGTFRAGVTFGF